MKMYLFICTIMNEVEKSFKYFVVFQRGQKTSVLFFFSFLCFLYNVQIIRIIIIINNNRENFKNTNLYIILKNLMYEDKPRIY